MKSEKNIRLKFPHRYFILSLSLQGNYTGLIFYHEGWPLCIHEKIIVQLASLHKVRLKPGDFYFQVVPAGKQAANLVLKCLSRHGPGMEELIVPETMYGYIFTTEFLENVNCERNGFLLESCLLTTGPAIYRTPWKNIVNPIFVPTAETILHKYSNNSLLDNLISTSSDAKAMTQTMESSSSHESSASNDTGSTVIEVPLADNHGNQNCDDSGLCHGSGLLAENLSSETSLEHGEDEDVNQRTLSGRYPYTDSVVEQTIKESEKTSELTPEFLESAASVVHPVPKNSTKNITFGTDLSSPRQRGRDSVYFETKRLFRKSYIEALQNPMNLGSSSEESIAEEEASLHLLDSRETDDDSKISENKICANSVQQENSWSERLSKMEETKAAIGVGDCSQASEKLQVSHQIVLPTGCRSGSRRSRSLDRTHKNSQNVDDKCGLSSDGMSSVNPKKLFNGHLVRLDKLDSRPHQLTSTKSKEDEGKVEVK